MADDLQNYKLQLQQVEAALLTDPENSELLKLKQDLEEVIDLTKDLIRAQQEAEQKKSAYIEPASTSYFEAFSAAEKKQSKPLVIWKVGDKCSAKWIEDGQYYDATIEAITDNGEVSIVFDAYQNRSTTTISELKERKVRNEVFPSNSNKRMRPNQKEYLKKKKQKKLIRFKELEEERETEKNKWLQFSAKNTKKTGVKCKSIFASPENVNGRVGIGTCGVSGKPMTEFSHGEKYRKGV
ncbi:survival of motor neuron-related-splicing factor 30-like [Toxorhynchites rutilus septentrionalis]|uniref:survival of motor neuron-related-splicing factor 30-like n=1 Tax=Toxorhynchites rutilus septentrionalis TaxID=329112 RepID=UPI002479D8E5|nr:survival of motor neuron-related-splicing factor 30-like [Toxorhynchites rutilus septentrionalis]